MILSIWLLFQGCFRGLFTEELRYQATMYEITSPRIVAIRSNPVNMIANEPTELDILLLAPQNSQIQNYKIDVCGLGNQTQTILWELSCFEDPAEVQTLISTDSLPFRFAAPDFPAPDCGYADSPHPLDSGLMDTGWQEDCSHHLPLMITATVDNQEYYAAAFTQWYGHSSTIAIGDSPLHNMPMGLSTNQSATNQYQLTFSAQGDLRDATIHWYIDAGELLQTGLTTVTEYTQASNDTPHGLSISKNQLIPPQGYDGLLRIWVVIHYPWYHQLDMAWIETSIEVNQ